MTIFLQFFRLSASFCSGAACPAVGPQAAQIPRQVGIAAPDMSGIQHPHTAPVPHTKARQHQCCPAPQVWCSHSGTMQFCAAAKVQQPSLAAGISPQGGKALRTGKAVLEQELSKKRVYHESLLKQRLHDCISLLNEFEDLKEEISHKIQ